MEIPIDEAMRQGDRRAAPDPTLLLDTRQVEVPIDHNPDAVIGEGPSAHAAKAAMVSIWATWNAVKAAAEDPATDLSTLARVSQQAVERGLASADRAVDTITAQIEALEQQIDSAIMPPQTDPFAGEIRNHWKSELTNRSRVGNQDSSPLGALMSAVKTDTRTASAVLSAPPYLSGLNDEQYSMLRKTAVDAHCPERQADLDEARRALGKVQNAADRVTKTLAPNITLWVNPEPTALRQLRVIANGGSDG